jgi:uncharacterized phage-associated protein
MTDSEYPLNPNDYTPGHVANYFLWKAQSEGKTITPLKLIKLVYIAYSWNLVMYKNRLFEERIEAWKYGPVIPSLYHEFKRFGSNSIDTFATELSLGSGESSPVFPAIEMYREEGGVVDAVWQNYGDKTGEELSNITHKGSPWLDAWKKGKNAPLDDKKIVQRSRPVVIAFLKELEGRNV